MWAGNITSAKEDKTETWDGTAWTEQADLPGTHFSYGAGSGTSTNALGAGGYVQAGPKIANSYEWTFSADVQTVAFD